MRSPPGASGSDVVAAAMTEAQALQRQGAALQVPAPGMIGELSTIEPVLPVVAGPPEPVLGLLQRPRRGVLAPPQRDEPALAFLEQGACGGRRTFEAHVQIRGQPQSGQWVLGRGRIVRPAAVVHPVAGSPIEERLGDRIVVTVLPVGPARGHPAVVEAWSAIHLHLDLSVDAADRPQQNMRRVVVGGSPTVGMGTFVLVVPRPDEKRIGDDQPTSRRPPTGFEHHRPGDVAACRGHVDPGRTDTEMAGIAIENGAEHAGGVHPRQAQPFHCAVRRHQRRCLTVGEECVVLDRWEVTPVQPDRLGGPVHDVPLPSPECS